MSTPARLYQLLQSTGERSKRAVNISSLARKTSATWDCWSCWCIDGSSTHPHATSAGYLGYFGIDTLRRATLDKRRR